MFPSLLIVSYMFFKWYTVNLDPTGILKLKIVYKDELEKEIKTYVLQKEDNHRVILWSM